MAALQVLRKRYKSIQATADMCSAMKTASSVKYAKISKVLANIEAYSRACDETLALFGDAVLSRRTETVKPAPRHHHLLRPGISEPLKGI